MSSAFTVASEFRFSPIIGDFSILSAFTFKEGNKPSDYITPFRHTYFTLPLGELSAGEFKLEHCAAYGNKSISDRDSLSAESVDFQAIFPEAKIVETETTAGSKKYYVTGDFYADVPASLRLQCLVYTSPDAKFVHRSLVTPEAAFEAYEESMYRHGKEADKFPNIFKQANLISFPAASTNLSVSKTIEVTAGGTPDSANGGFNLSLQDLAYETAKVSVSLGKDVSWLLIKPLYTLEDRKVESAENACIVKCNDETYTSIDKIKFTGNYQGYDFSVQLPKDKTCAAGKTLAISCPDMIVHPKTPGLPALARVNIFTPSEVYSSKIATSRVIYKSNATNTFVAVTIAVSCIASIATFLF